VGGVGQELEHESAEGVGEGAGWETWFLLVVRTGERGGGYGVMVLLYLEKCGLL
jgi:hypothetical protein